MRLLDLYCCEGGSATGYANAGFDVVGVDIAPQRRYPFEFHQGDAIDYLLEHGREFDAIHASPPCQRYTTMGNRKRLDWPDLIGPTRDALIASGKPWILENVTGARKEMLHPILLHGGMFGLGVDRPRLFDLGFDLMILPSAPRPKHTVGVYGKRPDGRRLWTRKDGTELRAASSEEEARLAMGMPWASWNGLREAIPPAYTEFLGGQLMRHLTSAASVETLAGRAA